MRRWVKWLLAAVVVVVLMTVTFGVWIGYSFVTARVDTVGEVDFDRELAIPPLAESEVDDEGRRVFDLTLQRGETDLGRDAKTETWGVNGSHLGPTLRAERGEEVLVNVTNELDEDSTLHWHGMHLPAEMDGGPHQMVDEGATWSPTWEIDQPASTLWYHPHPHGDTAEHVYRGIAGMFILDDEEEAALPLPREYGVDDIPLIVQDKEFDGSELDTSSALFESNGILGDTVLVNGTPGPYLDVTTERVRLRLLNGSNARVYNFHFSDDREYDVIASDGGLLPERVRRDHLLLSPGERAEIVVAFEPGETVELRSEQQDAGDRFTGADDRLDILQLRAADSLTASPEVPAELADVPELDADDVVETRDFELQGTSINGQDMDMERIDETVELDTTERWQVRNTHGQPHNFHIHDVQFVIESIDGKAPPPPELAGWKDTVFMPPHREVDLLVRFSDYADPDTPYMYHCHLLKHEDAGMMGQFVVVEPFETARPSPPQEPLGEEAGSVDGHHEH